jgi:ribosomal protein S18 acetylase RimI-like enzyme
MEFVVRQLGVGDAAALVDLFEAVLPGFSERYGFEVDYPAEFLSDPSSFVFGSYVDDEPAGLAWGVQIRYPTGRLMTYLHELDVRVEYRRQRIATSLVEHSMALARERGSLRFWLSTGGHNTAAQSLYDSLGGVRKPLGDVNYWWEFD